MKTFSKLIIVVFLIISATSSGAQSHKVIYNDNEITLPNFLQYNSEGIQESAIKGKMNNNLVYITWQTKAEINTSHFELQRSKNGKDFEPIETITAGGISKNISRYATTDAKYSFCYNKLYYRLKIVFINGNENFTDAITLELNTVEAATVYNNLP